MDEFLRKDSRGNHERNRILIARRSKPRLTAGSQDAGGRFCFRFRPRYEFTLITDGGYFGSGPRFGADANSRSAIPVSNELSHEAPPRG
jgi:hypothetical protein